jgi:hypothetical protein
MATSKKAKTVAAKAPVAKTGKAAGLPRAAKAPVAPAGGAKGSKMWMVPLVMLVALVLVGAFVVHHARYLASLKFDMVKTARVVPQGHDRGQATGLANVCADKQGQTFVLESDGTNPVRLQRFDAQMSPDTLVYQGTKAGQDLREAVDVDCDAQGTVYVVLRDGRIQVLDNNLKYLRTIVTGIFSPSAVSVNSAGRIYVADQQQNKLVFFDNKGLREGELGTPGSGTPLVNPVLMRVTGGDEIVVIENTETGLRGRIFTKSHSLRKSFLVDKIKYAPPVRLGVNGQDKAFFNDTAGNHGIACWDLRTGDYFGESQSTKDGSQFVSPGCIGGSRYSATVYVHTVVGLIKCELPAPEEGK